MSKRDRRDFLKEGALIAAALAVAPQSLFAHPHPSSTPPGGFTFKRFRPKLVDDPDPEGLVRAIVNFATPAITRQHTLTNGAHGVGPGSFGSPDGRIFFDWHRNYLHQLELALQRPVPSWAPWEPIPAPFLSPASRAGNVHQPAAITPTTFSLWSNEWIEQWRNIGDMGVSLSWNAHLLTHLACGGRMAVVSTASQAPIFWPWHAFVDEIARNYAEKTKGRIGPPGPPPPKSWPFATHQPAIPNGSSNDPVQLTPLVVGMSPGDAHRAIGDNHLQTVEAHAFHGRDRVISQRPLPFTPQRQSNGKVEISPNLEVGWARIS